MTPDQRAALYAILVAIGALVVGYGIITQDQVALWLALANAILNAWALWLARQHVPDAPDVTPEGPQPRRAYEEL